MALDRSIHHAWHELRQWEFQEDPDSHDTVVFSLNHAEFIVPGWLMHRLSRAMRSELEHIAMAIAKRELTGD